MPAYLPSCSLACLVCADSLSGRLPRILCSRWSQRRAACTAQCQTRHCVQGPLQHTRTDKASKALTPSGCHLLPLPHQGSATAKLARTLEAKVFKGHGSPTLQTHTYSLSDILTRSEHFPEVAHTEGHGGGVVVESSLSCSYRDKAHTEVNLGP